MNPNWEHSNLYAWEVRTFDFVERTPEERAAMLVRIGMPRYAYLRTGRPRAEWLETNTSQLDVDREIRAMLDAGVEIVGWYFWVNTDNAAEEPVVVPTFDAFRRHRITPQVWLPQSYADESAAEIRVDLDADAQHERVRREADRVASFVEIAADAGCAVKLYNHQGWYGMVDNQLQIIDELEERGIDGVGLVYNFTHSQGAYHDDQADFETIWPRIQARVGALNVYFLHAKSSRTAEMLDIVDRSGWRGPVGVIGSGDTEYGLISARATLDAVVARHAPGGAR